MPEPGPGGGALLRPEIVLVAAVARNGVIGNAGGMPWHLPADLRRFKAMTVGKPVVMGRKTFDSIGRPLPGRHNIILTRDCDWFAPGTTRAANLAEAIAAAGLVPATRAEAIMIIGGAEIYALAFPIATRLELTEIHLDPPGDALFPAFDRSDWTETARTDHAADGDAPAYSFVTRRRAG